MEEKEAWLLFLVLRRRPLLDAGSGVEKAAAAAVDGHLGDLRGLFGTGSAPKNTFSSSCICKKRDIEQNIDKAAFFAPDHVPATAPVPVQNGNVQK